MSALLASVRSVDEASVALHGDVDIIDLKEPSAGALGAVSLSIARDVVAFMDGHVPISATIGDLTESEAIAEAVRRIADTGVDIIKIGMLFDSGRAPVLRALEPLAGNGVRMVAVLFADGKPNLCVDDIRNAGFYGAMLDTADKEHGGLRSHLDLASLRQFVGNCRDANLFCGLAGSLGMEDVAELLPLSADYLGFRGALCGEGMRSGQLDSRRLATVRNALPRAISARKAQNACVPLARRLQQIQRSI
jgi:uncharacterized protein (UPF0264 family)